MWHLLRVAFGLTCSPNGREVRSSCPILPHKSNKMNELTVVDKTSEWRRMKALVLDGVSSPITKRVYDMAGDP